jgi:hypothetical protein
MLADDGRDDLVDVGDVAGMRAGGVEVAHQILGRQPLCLGQRRAEDGGDDHLVGAAEGAGKVLLEHAPAGRGRARLEHRPHAARRIAGAQGRERLVHGGRVMCEVVQHRDPAADPHRFEPALDPLERPQPLGEFRRGKAGVGAGRNRRQRVAHVVQSEQR